MALSPLPPTSDFITTGETKGTFKGALSGLRAFLNSLLGSTGAQADALTALGTLLNGSMAKTATYKVVIADRGKLVVCSGGSWTLDVDAAATLGAGFAFGVFNSDTGIITINPNLSETINSASAFVLGPGESCLCLVNSAADGLLAILTGGGGGSTGQVSMFSMNTAPTGWLKANGALVSRTTYAALFAAIGTTYGIGDGSTTFALPDLRGEFLRGWDDSRGLDAGRVFGSAQADAFKSHSHTQPLGASNAYDYNQAGASNSTALNIYTNTTSAAGGSETRPHNIAQLACIKY